MSKDPAVLFYTSDFISGTLLMSDDQRGKYILLLCLQHQVGYLTEQDMYKICKTYDKMIFDKFEKDDSGNYFNVRMKEETEKRKAYSESRAKNRKSLKNQDNPKDMLDISDTYEEHMENENENRDIIEGRGDKIAFADFWNLYEKKVGEKGKLEKKWNKLSNEEQLKIMAYIPEYKKAQPNKQYRKNPETFLNNKSWNDELISKVERRNNIQEFKPRTTY